MRAIVHTSDSQQRRVGALTPDRKKVKRLLAKATQIGLRSSTSKRCQSQQTSASNGMRQERKVPCASKIPRSKPKNVKSSNTSSPACDAIILPNPRMIDGCETRNMCWFNCGLKLFAQSSVVDRHTSQIQNPASLAVRSIRHRKSDMKCHIDNLVRHMSTKANQFQFGNQNSVTEFNEWLLDQLDLSYSGPVVKSTITCTSCKKAWTHEERPLIVRIFPNTEGDITIGSRTEESRALKCRHKECHGSSETGNIVNVTSEVLHSTLSIYQLYRVSWKRNKRVRHNVTYHLPLTLRVKTDYGTSTMRLRGYIDHLGGSQRGHYVMKAVNTPVSDQSGECAFTGYSSSNFVAALYETDLTPGAQTVSVTTKASQHNARPGKTTSKGTLQVNNPSARFQFTQDEQELADTVCIW